MRIIEKEAVAQNETESQFIKEKTNKLTNKKVHESGAL